MGYLDDLDRLVRLVDSDDFRVSYEGDYIVLNKNGEIDKRYIAADGREPYGMDSIGKIEDLHDLLFIFFKSNYISYELYSYLRFVYLIGFRKELYNYYGSSLVFPGWFCEKYGLVQVASGKENVYKGLVRDMPKKCHNEESYNYHDYYCMEKLFVDEFRTSLHTTASGLRLQKDAFGENVYTISEKNLLKYLVSIWK